MNDLLSYSTQWMYAHVLKPIFFQFNAELVHRHMLLLGSTVGKNKKMQETIKAAWSYQNPILNQTIQGISFPNPVGLAAGFDYNGDLIHVLSNVGFGFHTIGTVTLHPYKGNPPPQLGRFPRSRALLINKGLKNDGAKKIIVKLEKSDFVIPTGISIASTNKQYDSEQEQIEDISECFRLFEQSKVKHAYYELNISCPNTFGGEPFTTPSRLEKLLTAIDKLKIKKPVFIKFPIDQTEETTDALLDVIFRHTIQGIIVGNLTKDKNNPDVHEEDRKEWLTKKGNLSGKPTWKRSNALIAHINQVRRNQKKDFTIIGTGGIFSPSDAEEKLRLGADLVQLITGMIYQGPQLIGQINMYLAQQRATMKKG